MGSNGKVKKGAFPYLWGFPVSMGLQTGKKKGKWKVLGEWKVFFSTSTLYKTLIYKQL
jgi:hypothetical protein